MEEKFAFVEQEGWLGKFPLRRVSKLPDTICPSKDRKAAYHLVAAYEDEKTAEDIGNALTDGNAMVMMAIANSGYYGIYCRHVRWEGHW